MKRILIPTDFSSNAGDALAYALDFVKNHEVELHIINVVSADIMPAEVPAATAEIVKINVHNAEENMKALEAMAAISKKTNLTLTTNIIVGVASSAIRNEADRIGADVIIMGTRGQGHDAMDKLLGTVSSSVLNDAPCPIILVPSGYRFRTIDNIIFSTNLNHSDPYELWRATELIKPYTPTIRCIHVVEEGEHPSDELEQFAKYMIEKSPAAETIFNVERGRHIHKVIAAYAEDYDAEMIVMHREKKTLWTKIIGASYTKRMTSSMRLPLLVMN